jgi:hypothetical protein
MFKFELGQEIKDVITGYQGVVMVRAEYFTGCRHYGVLTRLPDKDGNERPWNWLDESRWEVVELPKVEQPKRKSSGPCPNGPNA